MTEHKDGALADTVAAFAAVGAMVRKASDDFALAVKAFVEAVERDKQKDGLR